MRLICRVEQTQISKVHSFIHSTYQLISEQKNRLQSELAIAKVEQILQARTQQVHHNDVVVALRAEPLQVGNANYSGYKKNETSRTQTREPVYSLPPAITL